LNRKYVLEKGRCDFCGHVGRVELYYNYHLKQERYACAECAKTLDEDWVKKEIWDMPSEMDFEDAEFFDDDW